MISLQVMSNSLIAILDNATTFILPSSDPRYLKILKVISNGFDEPKIKDILFFTDDNNKKEIVDRVEIDIEQDKVLIDKIEMPEVLKKKFLELQKNHKSKSHLINFWDRLQKNKNENSVKMLYKFLDHNGHPIMADGRFIAYKSVRMDLKDHHSGTNEHKVGRKIKIDNVNPDPTQTCSYGLHVATWEYAKNFNSESSRYLEVLVDPMDVVCVPNDYKDTKMRVYGYKVYREIKGPRDLTSQKQLLKKLVREIKNKKSS